MNLRPSGLIGRISKILLAGDSSVFTPSIVFVAVLLEGLILMEFKSSLRDSNLQSWNYLDFDPCNWANYNFGEVQEEIGNITSIEGLVVYSNNLTGIIPSSIGRLRRVKILRAGNNNFSGQIPAEISMNESLEFLGPA
nr:leucine-rich repeat receptor-like serine/threonine-protein kinase At1g17230 [Coffea arabica]